MCETCKNGELKIFTSRRNEVEVSYDPIPCPTCGKTPEEYLEKKVIPAHYRASLTWVRKVDEAVLDVEAAANRAMDLVKELRFTAAYEYAKGLDSPVRLAYGAQEYTCLACKDGTGNRTKICGVCGKSRKYYERNVANELRAE